MQKTEGNKLGIFINLLIFQIFEGAFFNAMIRYILHMNGQKGLFCLSHQFGRKWPKLSLSWLLNAPSHDFLIPHQSVILPEFKLTCCQNVCKCSLILKSYSYSAFKSTMREKTWFLVSVWWFGIKVPVVVACSPIRAKAVENRQASRLARVVFNV